MSAVNHLKDIPSVGQCHRYPTRHGEDLRTPCHRLTLSERNANFSGPFFFNRLPEEVKQCSSRLGSKGFGKQLKTFWWKASFIVPKNSCLPDLIQHGILFNLFV